MRDSKLLAEKLWIIFRQVVTVLLEANNVSGLRPKYTVTDRMTAALTEIERARGFLEAAVLSEDWIRTMANRAMLLEAHHTTHIEGTHLTLEQSERLLAGESVPDANPNDARELLNYRDAFNFVSDYMDDKGPISEGLIREIHKRLVQGVRGGNVQPGQYRTVQNYVVNSATKEAIYTPPPPGNVPELMRSLVKWLNETGETHPVLVSGIGQFELVHIHPFCDGNGRASRLLSTLCLYRNGYDFKKLFTISEYYDRDRPAFYKAIQDVRDHGMDLTGWLEFFVTGLAVQMKEVKDRGSQIIRLDVLVKKHGLNERQEKAVEFAIKQGSLHLNDYQEMVPDVDPRTLQRDLKKLMDLGIFVMKGHARSARYHLKGK
jgi:Fic family protein